MISVFILKNRIKSIFFFPGTILKVLPLIFLNNNACNLVILLEYLSHFCEDSGLPIYGFRDPFDAY